MDLRNCSVARAAIVFGTPACCSGSGAPTALAKDSTELKGEVSPNFTIELKNNGVDVKTLRAGTYTLKVEDKSSIHDFHLVGPG